MAPKDWKSWYPEGVSKTYYLVGNSEKTGRFNPTIRPWVGTSYGPNDLSAIDRDPAFRSAIALRYGILEWRPGSAIVPNWSRESPHGAWATEIAEALRAAGELEYEGNAPPTQFVWDIMSTGAWRDLGERLGVVSFVPAPSPPTPPPADPDPPMGPPAEPDPPIEPEPPADPPEPPPPGGVMEPLRQALREKSIRLHADDHIRKFVHNDQWSQVVLFSDREWRRLLGIADPPNELEPLRSLFERLAANVPADQFHHDVASRNWAAAAGRLQGLLTEAFKGTPWALERAARIFAIEPTVLARLNLAHRRQLLVDRLKEAAGNLHFNNLLRHAIETENWRDAVGRTDGAIAAVNAGNAAPIELWSKMWEVETRSTEPEPPPTPPPAPGDDESLELIRLDGKFFAPVVSDSILEKIVGGYSPMQSGKLVQEIRISFEFYYSGQQGELWHPIVAFLCGPRTGRDLMHKRWSLFLRGDDGAPVIEDSPRGLQRRGYEKFEERRQYHITLVYKRGSLVMTSTERSGEIPPPSSSNQIQWPDPADEGFERITLIFGIDRVREGAFFPLYGSVFYDLVVQAVIR